MKLIRYAITYVSLVGLLFTGCIKDPTVLPIAVDAGGSQVIQLPVDSVKLTGTVTTGITPGTTYLWTLVSGPSVPVFSNNAAEVTEMRKLVAGTYVLQFQATNNFGNVGLDTTSVVVTTPIVTTLVLQPTNSPAEANPSSYYPTGNGNGIPQFSAAAWTHGGADERLRTYIKFDYSSIPVNANIINARLTLYSTLTPGAGNGIDAQYGSENACNIRRITSDWNISSLNWNNQPASTDAHLAILPQSTSSFETDSIDVTQLVKDMIGGSNYGFSIMLQNEVIYNIRQYASSFYPDVARHPKLEITYQ